MRSVQNLLGDPRHGLARARFPGLFYQRSRSPSEILCGSASQGGLARARFPGLFYQRSRSPSEILCGSASQGGLARARYPGLHYLGTYLRHGAPTQFCSGLPFWFIWGRRSYFGFVPSGLSIQLTSSVLHRTVLSSFIFSFFFGLNLLSGGFLCTVLLRFLMKWINRILTGF
jgi:hypothetical protein